MWERDFFYFHLVSSGREMAPLPAAWLLKSLEKGVVT